MDIPIHADRQVSERLTPIEEKDVIEIIEATRGCSKKTHNIVTSDLLRVLLNTRKDYLFARSLEDIPTNLQITQSLEKIKRSTEAILEELQIPHTLFDHESLNYELINDSNRGSYFSKLVYKNLIDKNGMIFSMLQKQGYLLRSYDTLPSAGDLSSAIVKIVLLHKYSENALKEVQGMEDEYRPSFESTITHDLIGGKLPKIYKHFFGKKWGSSKPHGGGKHGGPAVRFTQSCLKIFGIESSLDGDAVTSHVKRYREAHNIL